MSGRKAEIVLELARRGDSNDGDGMRKLLHPEAAMWGPAGWPERGPMEGREAVLRQFQRLGEDYVDRRTEIDDITELDDWVVAQTRWQVRARRSGIESEVVTWVAVRLENEQLIEIRYFWNREEALKAATEGSAPGTR